MHGPKLTGGPRLVLSALAASNSLQNCEATQVCIWLQLCKLLLLCCKLCCRKAGEALAAAYFWGLKQQPGLLPGVLAAAAEQALTGQQYVTHACALDQHACGSNNLCKSISCSTAL
jgi:hypothetical protein